MLNAYKWNDCSEYVFPHTVTSYVHTILLQFNAVNLHETLLRWWCKMSIKTYTDQFAQSTTAKLYKTNTQLNTGPARLRCKSLNHDEPR